MTTTKKLPTGYELKRAQFGWYLYSPTGAYLGMFGTKGVAIAAAREDWIVGNR